jgi:hypothetical protein
LWAFYATDRANDNYIRTDDPVQFGCQSTQYTPFVVDGVTIVPRQWECQPSAVESFKGVYVDAAHATGRIYLVVFTKDDLSFIDSQAELYAYIDTLTLKPPPPPEPGVWHEDFEGLNLGEIGGQGHWVFFAGDGTVDNSQAFTGSRSLRLDNDGTRLLIPGGFLSDFGSMVTSYSRIGTIGSGAGGVMYFNDHQIAENPVTVSCHLGHFSVPGYISFNNEILKAVTENTWYKLDVQFDYSANRCRGRVDNENWSSWQNILPGNRPLHAAFIGSIGFAQRSTHEVWFDDISVSGAAVLE